LARIAADAASIAVPIAQVASGSRLGFARMALSRPEWKRAISARRHRLLRGAGNDARDTAAWRRLRLRGESRRRSLGVWPPRDERGLAVLPSSIQPAVALRAWSRPREELSFNGALRIRPPAPSAQPLCMGLPGTTHSRPMRRSFDRAGIARKADPVA